MYWYENLKSSIDTLGTNFNLYWIKQCKREGFLQRIKDEEGEGCNIYGFLEVNKVAGNFHFAPGKSFQQANVHVHDLLPFGKDSFNVSIPFLKWLILF